MHQQQEQTNISVPKWQMIKQLCIKQAKQFTQWDLNKQYGSFHCHHYDWWAFPTDRKSSYGNKYRLFPQDKKILYYDTQFLDAVRTNAILVCKSWGFDLQKGVYIKGEKDQTWQTWPIRLYKLVNCLQYFQLEDLFFNAIKFGLDLIDSGQDFSYGPKRLQRVFIDNRHLLKKAQDKKKQGQSLCQVGQKEQVNEAKQESKVDCKKQIEQIQQKKEEYLEQKDQNITKLQNLSLQS